MARFLVQRDGLFLGSSSAVNLVACVKLVRKLASWAGTTARRSLLSCAFVTPIPPLFIFSLALTPTNILARVSMIVRCDSGARHYSKVRLFLLVRILFLEAYAIVTISQTIVLVRHCGCCCGASELTETLWMDPGTTHICPRRESQSTLASFRICSHSRSRPCLRSLKYNILSFICRRTPRSRQR